jgi:tetratricopeptide (TPR) repeat protein
MKSPLLELAESRNLGNTRSFCHLAPSVLRIVAANLIIILLSLVLGAGAGLAAEAENATGQFNLSKALLESYNLIEKQQYKQAEALLTRILAQDPGNPLALSDKAAILVAQKKFDQAASCLQQAQARAKGYLVQANRTCAVGKICLAFKPAAAGTDNQELAPLIKTNIEMVKFMAAVPPQEKK